VRDGGADGYVRTVVWAMVGMGGRIQRAQAGDDAGTVIHGKGVNQGRWASMP